MRLNLGCGDDIRDGYVNIDFRQTHPAISVMDLSIFPWPIETGCVDEILMLDFLEHFPYSQTRSILLECHRVLRDVRSVAGIQASPGTGVTIQVPDAEILGTVLSRQGRFQCNRCGMWMAGPLAASGWDENCSRCGQSDSDVIDAAMKRLFGGQDFPGNFHHTCFTQDSLTRIARSCGLYFDRLEEKQHQAANWNFKAVFFKGDVW